MAADLARAGVELGGQGLGVARGLAVVDREVGARGVQLARNGRADAARAARDQHRLAG